MFCMLKKKRCILPMYQKHDSNSEKQVNLLMIPNGKGKNSLYCFNCFHSFRTKNKLKSNEKVCENKGFSNVVVPS